VTRNRYPTGCSGRRARRAQWLRDAALFRRCRLDYHFVPEYAAAILRAKSEALPRSA
jgi:hypothetical protein